MWTRVWDRGNFADDVPVKVMFVTNPNAIIVVGNSIDNVGKNNIVLLRYDLSGNLQSTHTTVFNSALNADDIVTDMTRDASR